MRFNLPLTKNLLSCRPGRRAAGPRAAGLGSWAAWPRPALSKTHFWNHLHCFWKKMSAVCVSLSSITPLLPHCLSFVYRKQPIVPIIVTSANSSASSPVGEMRKAGAKGDTGSPPLAFLFFPFPITHRSRFALAPNLSIRITRSLSILPLATFYQNLESALNRHWKSLWRRQLILVTP